MGATPVTVTIRNTRAPFPCPRVRTHKGGFLGQQGVLLSLPWREEAMSNQFWLSAAQFARLQPLLPTATRGVPRVDDRRVISGIVHVLQSGCRWRATPPVYGPSKTLYNRFVRWARKGVWERVFTALAPAGGPPETLMLDATYVKAHRSAGGGKGGRSSRRLGDPVGGGPRKSMPRSMRPAAPGG